MMTAADVACILIVLGLAIFAALAWPTREELEMFERVERSVEPTAYLELGVVLVVMAVVCAAATVFKFMLEAL